MKIVILGITFLIALSSMAAEVKTECQAMNGNREKIIKTASQSKSKASSVASKQ